MILRHPWALSGLALLAIPLAIHLLGRHRARVVKFPSLRFLAVSRLAPTRRTPPSDLLLLAIRLAIIAAAVVALSQPVFETSTQRAAREREPGQIVARAIVIDTSASMRRAVAGGEPAVRAARREAGALAAGATTSDVIETSAPAHVLAGASQWLEAQPGKRELVVVSDFQLGTIDSTAIGAIAPDVGVKLVYLDVAIHPSTVETQTGDRSARITPSGGSTEVEWGVASKANDAGPMLLAGAAERGRAVAAQNAAMALGGSPAPDPTRPVAIIYKEYDGRLDLMHGAKPIDQPWMGDAVARLHGDSTLVSAASTADVARDTALFTAPFAVVARNGTGQPVVLASRGAVGAREGLQLWVLADAGSLTSAALIAGLAIATDSGSPLAELEPRSLEPEVLSRWERPAGRASPRTGQPDKSDGRWFWLCALVLIGVETVIRRMQRRDRSPSVATRPQGDIGENREQHVA